MKKPKYNIGDRVILLQGKSIRGGLVWVSYMDYGVGRVFTIKSVYPHNNSVSYKLKNDPFYYDESWLTPEREEKPEEKRSGFKVGDRICYLGKPAMVVYKYPFNLIETDYKYLIRYDQPNTWAWQAIGNRYDMSIGLDPKAGNVYWNVMKKNEKNMEPLKDDVQVKADKKGKRTIVIRISDYGAEAQYIIGKKVVKKAKVTRYYQDTPDDFRAAVYAIDKMDEYKPIRFIASEMPKIKDDKTVREAAQRFADELSIAAQKFNDVLNGNDKMDFPF